MIFFFRKQLDDLIIISTEGKMVSVAAQWSDEIF